MMIALHLLDPGYPGLSTHSHPIFWYYQIQYHHNLEKSIKDRSHMLDRCSVYLMTSGLLHKRLILTHHISSLNTFTCEILWNPVNEHAWCMMCATVLVHGTHFYAQHVSGQLRPAAIAARSCYVMARWLPRAWWGGRMWTFLLKVKQRCRMKSRHGQSLRCWFCECEIQIQKPLRHFRNFHWIWESLRIPKLQNLFHPVPNQFVSAVLWWNNFQLGEAVACGKLLKEKGFAKFDVVFTSGTFTGPHPRARGGSVPQDCPLVMCVWNISTAKMFLFQKLSAWMRFGIAFCSWYSMIFWYSEVISCEVPVDRLVIFIPMAPATWGHCLVGQPSDSRAVRGISLESQDVRWFSCEICLAGQDWTPPKLKFVGNHQSSMVFLLCPILIQTNSKPIPWN